MTRFRPLFLAAAAVLVTLLVACGGSGKPGGGSGGASSQSLDLLHTAQNLLAVQSFQFNGHLKINVDTGSGSSGDVSPLLAALSDIDVQGSFVAPGDLDVTVKALDQQVHYVQIGPDAWLNYGDGWHSGSAVDISGFFSGTEPGTSVPDVVLQGAKTTSETVDGVHTTHYSFDEAALTGIAQNITGQTGVNFDDLSAANLDIWVTDNGLPVKLVSHIAGHSKLQVTIDANFDVTDVNSKITIAKPVP